MSSNFGYSERILRGGRLVRWQRYARFRAAARMMKQLGTGPDKALLDIGAADGIGLPFFEPLFGRVCCLNFYDNHTRELQERYPDHEAITADARDIPLPSGSFDAIVSLETLHLIPRNRLKAIAEAHRLLKPTGYMVLSVPIETGIAAITKYVARGVTGHQLNGMTFALAMKHVAARYVDVTQWDQGRQIGFDAGVFKASLSPWLFVTELQVLPTALLPFNLLIAGHRREAKEQNER